MAAQLVLDVSNNNGAINWPEVFKSGAVKGIYSKASQGVSFTDKFFGSARLAAQRAKVPFGAYHYFEPQKSPTDQADHFCTVVQQLHRTDLRPALDIEVGGLSPMFLTAAAHIFSKRVKASLGVYPLVYTYTGFLSNFTETVGAGLWLANYGDDDGKTEHDYPPPSPWKRAVMHQFTQHGQWPGIHGDVDFSFAHKGLPYAHPWLFRRV